MHDTWLAPALRGSEAYRGPGAPRTHGTLLPPKPAEATLRTFRHREEVAGTGAGAWRGEEGGVRGRRGLVHSEDRDSPPPQLPPPNTLHTACSLLSASQRPRTIGDDRDQSRSVRVMRVGPGDAVKHYYSVHI
ncbi:hypothetical protein E2C01_003932 [Portunus trituberculatus]|uniref:Uncharacterized protein n=1 Tax=Portunus trituberculatus TaxID=210409 RepID=A0A5B7CR26_PORTR|nr:hypothetical protein [Portunus trituberculatus]